MTQQSDDSSKKPKKPKKYRLLIVAPSTYNLLMMSAETAAMVRWGRQAAFAHEPHGIVIPPIVDREWLDNHMRAVHNELKRRWKESARHYSVIINEMFDECHPCLELGEVGAQVAARMREKAQLDKAAVLSEWSVKR